MVQGSLTQAPRLQAFPQPWQGLFQQLSGAHFPALGPKPAQTKPAPQVTPRQGSLQPFGPLHTHTGGVTQPGSSVPAGAQITLALASESVFFEQSPHSAV